MEKEEKAQKRPHRESPEEATSWKPREQSFKSQGVLNWVECVWSFPGTVPGAYLEEQKSSCALEGEGHKEAESTCEVSPFEEAWG